MTIPLGLHLRTGSSCQPGPRGEAPIARSLFGIAPGGACHAGSVARTPVGFTPPFHHSCTCAGVCSLWRFPSDCSARALPGTVSSGSPDFPRRDLCFAKSRQPWQCLFVEKVTGTAPFLVQSKHHAAAIQPSAQAPLYAPTSPRSSPNRVARSAITAQSTPSNGPCAQGRNRIRTTSSSKSSAMSP